VLGLAATVGRAGATVGKAFLLPARAVFGTALVRGRLTDLAESGREVEAGARRRIETAAENVLAAPEMERTLDSALAGPLPEALARSLAERRVVERVVREALDDEQKERIVKDVLASREFQTMLEEAIASAAVRAALARQTATVAEQTAARVRAVALHLDDAVERPVRRFFRCAPRAAAMPYAGIATRTLALGVDSLLIASVFLIGAAFVWLVASLAGGLRPDWLGGVLAGVWWFALVVGYFVGFWSAGGQTPGMGLMRVRVLAPGGGSPGGLRSFVRLVGLVLGIIPLFAGALPVLFDPRRRALPDYLARTDVVHAD
jgi:uncharacterized RDD family membrane protein YckC